MSEDDDDDVAGELIVKYSLDVKTLRIMDNEISPCNFKLKCEIINASDANIPGIDIKFTLMKIRFFFEEIISNGIIWSVDNEWANDVFFNDDGVCTLGNIPVITPYDPTDDHLAILFQSKMNAFAATGMEFNFVELEPTDNDVSFLFVGDAEEVLPTVEEWLGERRYFDKSWWSRDDYSSLDIIPDDDADLNDKPDYSLDFLKEHLMPKEIKNAKIIKPEFKPQIIKGGLDDDET